MNQQQFQELVDIPVKNRNFVTIVDLQLIKTEGTLIYGRTLDKALFHLYVKDNLIHRYVYRQDKQQSYISSTEFNVIDCVPSKIVYPTACDYNFCRFLIRKGIKIPFTNWDDRKEELYYGEVNTTNYE